MTSKYDKYFPYRRGDIICYSDEDTGSIVEFGIFLEYLTKDDVWRYDDPIRFNAYWFNDPDENKVSAVTIYCKGMIDGTESRAVLGTMGDYVLFTPEFRSHQVIKDFLDE